MVTEARIDGNDINDIIAGSGVIDEGLERHPHPFRFAHGEEVPEWSWLDQNLSLATKAELAAQITGKVIEIVGDELVETGGPLEVSEGPTVEVMGK